MIILLVSVWGLFWFVLLMYFFGYELFRHFIKDPRIESDENLNKEDKEKKKEKTKNGNINASVGLGKGDFVMFAGTMIIIVLAFLSFKDTSLINKQSIELVKDINRPYLFIDKIDLEPFLGDEYDYKLTIAIKNAGPIPALQSNYVIDFAGNSMNFYDGEQPHLYGPGGDGGVSLFISKEKVLSIRNDTDPRKYLNVQIEYRDPKGNSYCVESSYSSVIIGKVYKINAVSSDECKR